MKFQAAPDRWLVPFDGSFRISDAATEPPDPDKKSKSYDDALDDATKELGDWQHRMFANGRYAVLIVFQALDAAGKDGTIRHVFSRINPNGLRVVGFKAPTPIEAEHDFLWRTVRELPARGHVTVFNRSYYEEVLAVRVHPEFLDAQRLPEPTTAAFWAERWRSIVDHERHLANQGTVVLKFWLNVSKAEQRKRFLERIEEPDKRWKFRLHDLDERALWDRYIEAYEDCLNATSRPWAPWYAIPADDKHYMRWQVARIINDAFEQLDVDFPEVEGQALADLDEARKRLGAE